MSLAEELREAARHLRAECFNMTLRRWIDVTRDAANLEESAYLAETVDVRLALDAARAVRST